MVKKSLVILRFFFPSQPTRKGLGLFPVERSSILLIIKECIDFCVNRNILYQDYREVVFCSENLCVWILASQGTAGYTDNTWLRSKVSDSGFCFLVQG